VKSCIAYMSTFYCRADLGKRVAVFFSATSLAGAFSGLLAAALLNMEGLSGKRGWQWIFIMFAFCTRRCYP
jgi:MFS family permease